MNSWLFVVLLGLSSAAAAGERVRLVVHHINDVHGWILPRKATFHKRNPERLVGGCGALGGFLATQERGDLLLDAGDWYQGTPEGGLTRGEAPIECFNRLGVDAATIGNHEFDDGQAMLKEMVSKAKFDVLVANVYEEATGKRVAWAKPYAIKEVRGVKVGLFGLVTKNMKNLAFPENIRGLRFRREADEAAEIVAELRARGAELVVALTHIGIEGPGETYEGDKHLAAAVPGIDLIVGGHSHKALQPSVRVGAALIVQAGSYLSRVGKVVLVVDRDEKRVVSSYGRVLDLWLDRYGEDPKVSAAMKRYEAEVGKKLDVVVATAAATMTRIHKAESEMGNWLSDCMRRVGGVDIAFQNAGGIRANIDEGPVTLRHLYQVMPFDNRLVTMRLTGRQVREVLEHGVSGQQGMIQVSGLEFDFDAGAPPGSRLAEVRVHGRPLADGESYRAATNDFLVSGGDGYGALGAGADVKKHDLLIRDALGRCAREQSPIRPPALGRARPASAGVAAP